MFKFVCKIFKKIIFYVLMLYSFNLIASPMNLIIPINLITVFSLLILGVPALFSFILISVLIF